MSELQVEVRITPRAGLLDPQGKAVANALRSLDFAGVGEVRVGRLIRVQLEAGDTGQAWWDGEPDIVHQIPEGRVGILGVEPER